MPDSNLPFPDWFVFTTAGALDLRKTLSQLPMDPDLSHPFFEVPDWFELTPEILKEILDTMNNMTEAGKRSVAPAIVQEIQSLTGELLDLEELSANPSLNSKQKIFLRAACYWKTLQLMESIPSEPTK